LKEGVVELISDLAGTREVSDDTVPLAESHDSSPDDSDDLDWGLIDCKV
jgi:hypothetical protein